jgi:hypothetical protein
MMHGGTIDRESYMNNIQEAAKMGKGYEALIDKSMELGALEARLVRPKRLFLMTVLFREPDIR